MLTLGVIANSRKENEPSGSGEGPSVLMAAWAPWYGKDGLFTF